MYGVCAVWGMHFVPGVDFLLPGILCSMQEQNRPQTVWLMVCAVLIHEGTGLLAFGPAVLWYAMACLLFYVGRNFFEAENIVFVLLLSACLGCWNVVIGYTMQPLQDVVILLPRLLYNGALNVLLVPPVWLVVYWLREKERRNVHAS